MAKEATFLGLVAILFLNVQDISSNDRNTVLPLASVVRQEDCKPSETLWHYCKNNNVYAIDDCGNHELVQECEEFEAVCYQGECEERVYRR